MPTAEAAENTGSNITANASKGATKGATREADGLADAGVPKNTQRIQGATTYRTPDGWDQIANNMYEIKSCDNLSLTRQLTDFLNYAKNTPGTNLILYVERDTNISSNLLERIVKENVEVRIIPPHE